MRRQFVLASKLVVRYTPDMASFFRLVLISLIALNGGYCYGQTNPPAVEIVSVVHAEAESTCQGTAFLYAAMDYPVALPHPPVVELQESLAVITTVWFQSSPCFAAHRGNTREAHSTL